MSRLKPLQDQVIVVTGSSSGIGLATARLAASNGAKVVLIGRAKATLAPIVEAITADGGAAAYAVADVGDRAELAAAADYAVRTFGRIDSWISNAGVAIYADLLATPRDEHEQLFRTNCWGTVNSCEIAVEYLRAQGGALIVVGSIAPNMGSPVMGAYVARKHALKGYVDSLRIELKRDRVPVVVTLVRPSGIDTPLPTHVANHRRGEPKIPPPIYTPELVARARLHTAAHPMQEVTVGGLGLAQVLVATHFPKLFASLAGPITPSLNDPRRQATAGDNLFTACSGGHAKGLGVAGRPFSVYTDLRLHALATAVTAMTLGTLTVIILPLARRRRRM